MMPVVPAPKKPPVMLTKLTTLFRPVSKRIYLAQTELTLAKEAWAANYHEQFTAHCATGAAPEIWAPKFGMKEVKPLICGFILAPVVPVEVEAEAAGEE